MGHHQIKRNNCVKRKPAEQEEAFAGHPSDRGLMLEQIKKTNQQYVKLPN